MNAAIELEALSKYYGPVVGVEGLSLRVEPGEVFGFVGSNGAGKTTTIRMLLDLLRPSSGRARVLGFDCHTQSLEVRRRVGYLPGEMPIYPDLTGAEYLDHLARVGGSPAPHAHLQRLLERFEVSALDLRRVLREQSQGMKRKFGILQALMADAPVLILDEPTSGLDPLMIQAFCDVLNELRREGRKTVFLSSHILSEVEKTCDRVGLIRRGKLAAVAAIEQVRAELPRRVSVLFSEPVTSAFADDPQARLVERAERRWVFEVRQPLGALLQRLQGLPLHDLEVETLGLEDYLLRLYAADGPGAAA